MLLLMWTLFPASPPPAPPPKPEGGRRSSSASSSGRTKHSLVSGRGVRLPNHFVSIPFPPNKKTKLTINNRMGPLHIGRMDCRGEVPLYFLARKSAKTDAFLAHLTRAQRQGLPLPGHFCRDAYTSMRS